MEIFGESINALWVNQVLKWCSKHMIFYSLQYVVVTIVRLLLCFFSLLEYKLIATFFFSLYAIMWGKQELSYSDWMVYCTCTAPWIVSSFLSLNKVSLRDITYCLFICQLEGTKLFTQFYSLFHYEWYSSEINVFEQRFVSFQQKSTINFRVLLLICIVISCLSCLKAAQQSFKETMFFIFLPTTYEWYF